MNTASMRSRILTVLGPGALSLFVACGGESSTDTTNADASAGGTGAGGSGGTAGAPQTCFSPAKAWDMSGTPPPGTGGSAGSGGTVNTGGVAGQAGSAGQAGAAGASDGGVADAEAPDAWLGCPSSIPQGFCSGYQNLEVVNGNCCYTYWNGGNACGRPFMIGSEARRAAAIERGDWLVALPPTHDDERLDDRTRAALRDGWLEDARLEHASVASFSRFVLHLLSFGAPSELVRQALRASEDEVEHARGCFALASRYARSEVGPSTLSLDGALPSPTLAEAAAAAVNEGCVGETLAAIQASEQLSLARDPAARRVLETISEDEARHAELAWRFVRWALEVGGGDVRHAVAEAFRRAWVRIRSEVAGSAGDIAVDALHAHGRLTDEERVRCHRRAVDEVLAPCAATLLAMTSRDASDEPRAVALS